MALKTIVVGLDGLSPHTAEVMMTDGALPNLARLRASGGYARIRTTSPAQTPVAWSTFATGKNPGAHGIFDFLRRDPRHYQPDLGLSRYERRSRLLPPKAVNLRSGETLWEQLGEQLHQYERELLRLSRERSRAALASYRSGRGDLRLALDAYTQEIEFVLEHAQLLNERGRAWAFLRYLGPEHLHH